jgi:probable DNA repair protein
MGSNETNHVDIDTALEAMSQSVQVITANRRLALELKGRYDQSQANQGKQAWESANILSWGDWLQSQFQDLQDLGLTDKSLLTPHQNHTLWEQIIRQSSRDQGFLNLSSVAKLAQDAWTITQSWQISSKIVASYTNSETELFLSWANSFENRISQENWIDSSQVPTLVEEQIVSGALNAPGKIILAGFDEIAPQHSELLHALNEKGCDISYLTSETVENKIRRFQAVETKQELLTAVHWAIKRLQSNHDARVGIVVPKLTELRREVEQILDRCLDPMSILPGSTGAEKAYNISIGTPLDQCPLVMDAMVILRFAGGFISSSDLSRLLRSPYIAGSKEEGDRRARLDAYIRSSLGAHEISIDTLIRKLRDVNGRESDSCPVLLKTLQEFRKTLDHLRRKQSPQNWIEEFQKILNTFGWCRSEAMESNEYQQLEKFNSIFSSFQQLGQIKPSMQLQEAIGHLHKIATDTPFHAQGGSDASIQVVGMLEAAGLRFDHLWIIGLSDDIWPEPAAPNPLLPISLQRKLGLPHASPQRELEYASAITQRLLSGAEEVVVSHAQTDGKNQLRASSLIAQLPEISIDELDIAQLFGIGRIGFGSGKLEQIVDNTGSAIPPGTHLTGGSGLLNDQSACPFRAYANHRLGAIVLEEPVSGVDARIKGIITHRVLQILWQQLGDQDRLLSIDGSKLQQLVEKTVSDELSTLKKQRPETFTPRFLEIEQDRLTELILAWLELEKQRTPFKAVSLEQKERINLSGLELDVRADRVDLLEDGSKLIIDYKTGKSLSYRGWFEQRIGEPQLPLYSTIASEEISGVCLAGVNRAKLGFKGITEQAGVIPGVKEFSKNRESADYSDWDGLKKSWNQRLEQLAKEIMSGTADVMPKDQKVCERCPLPSLCRIHEWGEDS